jgi:hypothetical protein
MRSLAAVFLCSWRHWDVRSAPMLKYKAAFLTSAMLCEISFVILNLFAGVRNRQLHRNWSSSWFSETKKLIYCCECDSCWCTGEILRIFWICRIHFLFARAPLDVLLHVLLITVNGVIYVGFCHNMQSPCLTLDTTFSKFWVSSPWLHKG